MLPGSTEAAREVLETDAEAQEHLERVARLIEGFETPYSMELLASIHHVVHEKPELVDDAESVVAAVQSWTQRKGKLFTPEHIKVAWRHLREEGWLTAKEQREMRCLASPPL